MFELSDPLPQPTLLALRRCQRLLCRCCRCRRLLCVGAVRPLMRSCGLGRARRLRGLRLRPGLLLRRLCLLQLLPRQGQLLLQVLQLAAQPRALLSRQRELLLCRLQLRCV